MVLKITKLIQSVFLWLVIQLKLEQDHQLPHITLFLNADPPAGPHSLAYISVTPLYIPKSKVLGFQRTIAIKLSYLLFLAHLLRFSLPSYLFNHLLQNWLKTFFYIHSNKWIHKNSCKFFSGLLLRYLFLEKILDIWKHFL